jgi:hypothetical protein
MSISASGDAAVDEERLTGDEAGLFAREETASGADVLRDSPSAEGHSG